MHTQALLPSGSESTVNDGACGSSTTDPDARRLPRDFWIRQWITALYGSAVALLIALLDLQGGRKSPAQAPSLATDQRRRYSLSDDTWTRATGELVSHELLIVRRVAHGRDFDWRRMRNTYSIRKERLDEPPDSLTSHQTW